MWRLRAQRQMGWGVSGCKWVWGGCGAQSQRRGRGAKQHGAATPAWCWNRRWRLSVPPLSRGISLPPSLPFSLSHSWRAHLPRLAPSPRADNGEPSRLGALPRGERAVRERALSARRARGGSSLSLSLTRAYSRAREHSRIEAAARLGARSPATPSCARVLTRARFRVSAHRRARLRERRLGISTKRKVCNPRGC